MKLWTYGESLDKVTNDNDLQEIFEDNNAFVNKNEMIGYFNEALTKASTDIQSKSKDYFLTKAYLQSIMGEKQIALPENIMANKIRQLRYINGATNYEVLPYMRSKKFADMSFADQYGPNDYYNYSLMNDYSGQAVIEIHPAMRETAVIPSFTPLTLWYIRNCARIPLIGEFCNPELVLSASVDAGADTIAVVSGNRKQIGIPWQGRAGCAAGSIAYVTGDAVRVEAALNGTLPAPLVEDTTYYVIAVSSTSIKLATTKVNAKNGVNIDLTDVGTAGLIIRVQATENIVAATILDIPEFNMYLIQFVKCKILSKERDPSLATEIAILQAYNEQMMDTLSDAVQDNNSDNIEADFSAYEEML